MKGGTSKYAYTLIELVISITISAIILLGLLRFVGDTLYELSLSNNSSKVIISLSEVIDIINDFNSVYEKKKILIDIAPSVGSDALLFTDSGSTSGILIALVDPNTSKVFTGANYGEYNKKHLGYKQLSQAELALLNGDSALAYDYTFFNDKIYTDVFIKDFQLGMFNSQKIINIDLGVLLEYKEEKEGVNWTEIGKDNIYNLNLNF